MGTIAGRPFDGPGQAGALAVMGDDAVTRNARVKGQCRLIAHRTGDILGQRRVEAGCRNTIFRHIIERSLRPARGVIAQLAGLGMRIGCGQIDAERPISIAVIEQAGNLRPGLLAEVVISPLRRQRAGQPRLAAQRMAGIQIHHRAQRPFIQRSLGGLVNDQRLKQLGRENVEIEGPARIGGAAAARVHGCGLRLHTVDPNRGEIAPQPANGDLAALAAVAGNRHAGDTLHRFRQILVGELADILGNDGVNRADRLAFDVEPCLKRLAIAAHHNDIRGRRIAGPRRGCWRGSRRGLGHCDRRRDQRASHCEREFEIAKAR